jgi:hypothetical protein
MVYSRASGLRTETTRPAPSHMQLPDRFLAQRRDLLQQEWTLRDGKLDQLLSAYTIESGASAKYQLEQQQIQSQQAQQTQLKAELDKH